MMAVVERALPSGTVTFLFSDVEGSTRLLGELENYPLTAEEAFVASGGALFRR
jgi:class 3 adenylate cyclase